MTVLVRHRVNCGSFLHVVDLNTISVLDVTIPDIACNKGGETGAKASANVAAGDKIVFDWVNVRIAIVWIPHLFLNDLT